MRRRDVSLRLLVEHRNSKLPSGGRAYGGAAMKAYLRRLFSRSSEGSVAVTTTVIDESPSAICRRRSELVEQRAHLLWNAEGRIAGRDVYYWLRAQEEIAAELGERQV